MRPGCTPGPSQADPSTSAAASHAARSAPLCPSRAATGAAISTASLSRATAARRNARASARIASSGAGESPTAASRGSRSTCIQRWPGAGSVYPAVVTSLSREPMTSRASAVRSRSATTPWAAVAGHAEVEGVVVGHDVAAPPGGDHRDVQQLGEPHEVVGTAGAQDAGAGEDDRPLRGGEHVQHRPHVGGRRDVGVGAHDRGARALGDLQVQDVLGQRQQRRARAGPRPWPGPPPRAWPPRSPGRRSRPPTWPAGRSSRRGRPPGTPPGPGRRGRPGRPGRTSGWSRRSRCGCRWRGWRRRRRASRGTPPAGR